MSRLSDLSRRLIRRGLSKPDRAFSDFAGPVQAFVNAMDEARQMQSGAVYVLPAPDDAKARMAAMVEAGLPAYHEALSEALLDEPAPAIRRARA